MRPHFLQPRHGTTILCVRKGDTVCLAGDGQVSQGNLVVKPNAKKIRRLPQGVILGFAGATADCFALLEKLEQMLEQHPGQLVRSCVDLAKQWRTDRYLRHLEVSDAQRAPVWSDRYRCVALFPPPLLDPLPLGTSFCCTSGISPLMQAVLIVADEQLSLEVSGVGDVLESHDGILAVGSGGPYAAAAARALYDIPDLTAQQICEKAMKIAADMCCHTNHQVIYETLPNISTKTVHQGGPSSSGLQPGCESNSLGS
ncbi:uncharacterized protein LOC34618982 [Cyclospora cayetanensis]|uniref:Uncharacterized protein LOC34618982 n=1 Tax=Cyclospora cayetanensis TaxID=88456 RepID=A0A6P6RZW8_9EIME|nr:uncharacterized protein LOC34618982 [Cyclospora cayetanensis]